MKSLNRMMPTHGHSQSVGRAVLNAATAMAVTTLWVLGCTCAAHAQGSRKDDIVFNTQGRPMAGATVRICTSSASGQPCSPLANIYSDVGLTQALANPTTTDGLGNYSFYATPGKYMVELSGPNIATKQIPNVILPNDPSAPTFATVTTTSGISAFSLSLAGNLTVTGSAAVSGALTVGGSGVPTTGGANTWTGAQTFNNSVSVGQAGNVAQKNVLNDAVCYVSSNGNDSNDGLSWGTSKATLNGCMLVLPNGSAANHTAGTGDIFVSGGTAGTIYAGGDEGGVLLLGSNDPHWNNVISSCSRSSNVVTLTFGSAHGYILSPTGQPITVYNTTGGATSFNENFTITGGTTTTLTYNQTGPNESCTSSTGAVLPEGFLKEGGNLRFVGYGILAASNSAGPPTVRVTNPASPNTFPTPVFQLAGTNDHYSSDGIYWNGCYGVVLGRDSNFAESSGAASFSEVFDNFGVGIGSSNIGCGPAVDIGRNVLWAQFKNGSIDALGQTAFSIDSLTRASGVTSVVLSSGPITSPNWMVGDQIEVKSFSDTTYNGVFTIVSVTDGSHFTYNNGPFSNCSSSCGSGGNVSLGPNNNRRAAVLFEPNGGNSGIVYVDHTTFNGGGGIRVAGAPGSGSSIYAGDILEEGTLNSQPVYECSLVGLCPAAHINDVGLSDSGDEPPAVKIGIANNNSVVTRVDCGPGQQAIATWGPASLVNCPTRPDAINSTMPVESPAAMGQSGVVTSVSNAFSKFIGKVDDVRRNFAPVNVPFTNLATTACSSWTNVTGGALTITTGISDPTHNSTNACNLSVSSSNGEADSYSASRTIKSGDYLMAGAWIKSSSTAGLYPFGPDQLRISLGNAFPRDIGKNTGNVGGNLIQSLPDVQDDGAWQFQEAWDSVVTTGTASTQTIKLQHFVIAGYPESVYAPILLHIPLSSLSRASSALSSVASGNGLAMFTTSAAHSFVVNQNVCVQDVTDTSYNNCYQILQVPSTTTFLVAYGGTSTSSSGGTAYATADSEAAEIAQALPTWANSCSVGQLCSVNGPMVGGALSTKSSSYTLTTADSWTNVTGTTTITVPHAIVGQRWVVFNSGGGTVTVQADSGSINGGASITLSANTGKEITCDGSNCFAH